MLLCYAQILALFTLLAVEAELFKRIKTKLPTEDIVRTIPSSTATSCVLSCKNSHICKQPALSEARDCLHLSRVFAKSVDVELFDPVQHTPPNQSGKDTSPYLGWVEGQNDLSPQFFQNYSYTAFGKCLQLCDF